MTVAGFTFPKLTPADIAFSTLRTNQQLLEEAKRRGFYNAETPYNKLFSDLFYGGGRLNLKEGYDHDMLNYFKALARSFEPRHEEKEAVCALLLSELVEVE